MKSLLKRLRQRFCDHECKMVELRRINPETVGATCIKCGKLMTAAYGLDINCRWVHENFKG